MDKNMSTTSKVANAYHTKDGGTIIPLGQFAREALNDHPETIDQHIKVEKGSVLTFERQLPKNVAILGHSKVNLAANAFINNTTIKDSRVNISGKGIVNIDKVNIDHSKIAMNTDNDTDIINYDIQDSLLKGRLYLVSKNRNLCSHVYGDTLQAKDSNFNGGVYSHVIAINSNIDQPGSTLFYNTNINHSSIVNHEQTNKHWTALRQDPKHQIEDSVITNSFILNDRHHHFYLSGSHINNAISMNGLLGELSEVHGPQQKIILNNMELSGNRLEFADQQKPVLVSGSKILNPHVHENDIYYTELPENRKFTTKQHDHHFKDVPLKADLIEQIDRFATETNQPDTNQAKVTELDKAINQALNTKPPKIKSKIQSDFLDL